MTISSHPTIGLSHRRDGWGGGERERLVPRLVAATPDDLADATVDGRRRVLDLMMRALAAERRRGRSGHWSYSLARHAGLIEAIEAELALWRDEGRTPPHLFRAPGSGERAKEKRRGR